MDGQNAAAASVDAALHDIVFGVAIRGARIAAEAQFPFLGYPIVSQLFSLGLNWFGGFIYKPLAQTSTFGVIDVQVSREKADCRTTLQELRQALASGSAVAIREATLHYELAFGRAARNDGSAPA